MNESFVRKMSWAAVLAVACGAVVAATRGVNTAKKKLHLPDGPAPAPKEP